MHTGYAFRLPQIPGTLQNNNHSNNSRTDPSVPPGAPVPLAYRVRGKRQDEVQIVTPHANMTGEAQQEIELRYVPCKS
jgi:hypothetical protein